MRPASTAIPTATSNGERPHALTSEYETSVYAAAPAMQPGIMATV